MACYYGDLNKAKLKKLQRRAIKLVTDSHYIAHTEPLFKIYYKLNVNDLYHAS